MRFKRIVKESTEEYTAQEKLSNVLLQISEELNDKYAKEIYTTTISPSEVSENIIERLHVVEHSKLFAATIGRQWTTGYEPNYNTLNITVIATPLGAKPFHVVKNIDLSKLSFHEMLSIPNTVIELLNDTRDKIAKHKT